VTGFSLERPHDLAEAVRLRAQYDDSVVLAGGQSLMILLRQRIVVPDVVISLDRVEELRRVEHASDGLSLGSMVTYTRVHADENIARCSPLAAAAASRVGSVHIRNRGTVGGGLCHADPAGDVPVALLAHGATLVIAGPNGTRTEPIDGFFRGLFETSIGADEILLGIRVPPSPPGVVHSYRRFSYRAGEYPQCVAAVQIGRDIDGRCTSAQVAVGGAGPCPRRLPELERELVGTELTDADIRAAVRSVRPELRPIPDVRGDAPWKVRVLTHVLHQALADTRQEELV
jgi:carbon-monoxide dehydrogenase medium subunit